MRDRDLRIGNWYNSVKFNTSVQCTLSDLYDLCANSDGAYTDPPIDKMFSPIPLDESWLVGFGFVWVDKILQGWQLEPLVVYPSMGLSDQKVVFKGSKIECIYVHQLQNLYHSLTGNELKRTSKGGGSQG